jgi:hypothetical protein
MRARAEWVLRLSEPAPLSYEYATGLARDVLVLLDLLAGAKAYADEIEEEQGRLLKKVSEQKAELTRKHADLLDALEAAKICGLGGHSAQEPSAPADRATPPTDYDHERDYFDPPYRPLSTPGSHREDKA